MSEEVKSDFNIRDYITFPLTPASVALTSLMYIRHASGAIRQRNIFSFAIRTIAKFSYPLATVALGYDVVNHFNNMQKITGDSTLTDLTSVSRLLANVSNAVVIPGFIPFLPQPAILPVAGAMYLSSFVTAPYVFGLTDRIAIYCRRELYSERDSNAIHPEYEESLPNFMLLESVPSQEIPFAYKRYTHLPRQEYQKISKDKLDDTTSSFLRIPGPTPHTFFNQYSNKFEDYALVDAHVIAKDKEVIGDNLALPSYEELSNNINNVAEKYKSLSK